MLFFLSRSIKVLNGNIVTSVISLFNVVAVIVYVECCSVGDINRREDPQVL